MVISPGIQVDRYHIIEQLGEGGMAVVYKAFDIRLECEVAVKFIRMERLAQETMASTLKRFEREAKAVAQLTHANIVKVTDYGEYEGVPYLVMEYLPGGTLKQYLGTPMPYAQAARLLAPVADALQYAHSKNIIHRDVKPSNILITESGQPMLTDFGIAKILDLDSGQTLTGTGVGIGTPEYMSPEQWTGHITPASDIYSLGIVFYELVTGHKPYSADTPAAVLIKSVNDPLPQPSSFVAELPKKVEHVLYKALAKKPADRYASMEEFKKALEGICENQDSVAEFKPPIAPAEEVPTYSTLSTQDSPRQNAIGSNPVPSILPDQQYSFEKNNWQEEPQRRSHVWVWVSLSILAAAAFLIFGLGAPSGWLFAPAATEAPAAPTEAPYEMNSSTELGAFTLGREGIYTEDCEVSSPGDVFSQADLFAEGHLYFAVPVGENNYGQTIDWSVTDPSGQLLYQDSREILQSDDGTCFWQGFDMEGQEAGDYVLNVEYEGSTAFRENFTITYSDLSSIPRPDREPFGNFQFGSGWINTDSCTVENEVFTFSPSEINEDPWLYFVSPFQLNEVGRTVYWQVVSDEGDVFYKRTAKAIEDDINLCWWQGFSLEGFPAGSYWLIVEDDSSVIYRKDFQITDY